MYSTCQYYQDSVLALPQMMALNYNHISVLESFQITQSMAFVVLGSIYSLVTGIPWSIYKTFVIEEQHGFNKQV